MSDQTLDDPTIPDAQLPQADRDKIRDTAKALSDGTLRMDSDAFAALPPRIQRRAWLRYQASAEDREVVRERNARQRAAAENHDADVRRARRLEDEQRQAEEDAQRRRQRTQSATTTSTADGMTAATFEERVAGKDSPSG